MAAAEGRARGGSGRNRLRRMDGAADEEDFERLVDQSLIASAPALIAVRIDDKPGVGTTDRDPVQVRQRFMLGLGVRQEVKTG